MSDTGFTDRLRGMVAESSSERAFAREVGIPQGTLRGLLAGKSPTLETLTAIVSAKGVEYRWLATGAGPQFAGQGVPRRIPTASFDAELLGRVVDKVARVYREEGVRLQDVELGRIAAERYAEIVEFSDDPDERLGFVEVVAARVRKAIRAAAADPGNVKHQA